MRIKTQDYDDITVIEIAGDLEGDVIEPLRNTVKEIVNSGVFKSSGITRFQSKNGVVLDLSDVGYIDSEGLEFLLWLREYCNENHCQARIAGFDENCNKILEITRLNNELNCYSELSEAVKSLA